MVTRKLGKQVRFFMLCCFLSFLVFGKFSLPYCKKSSMVVAFNDSEQLLCAPTAYEEHFYCFKKGEEIHEQLVS